MPAGPTHPVAEALVPTEIHTGQTKPCGGVALGGGLDGLLLPARAPAGEDACHACVRASAKARYHEHGICCKTCGRTAVPTANDDDDVKTDECTADPARLPSIADILSAEPLSDGDEEEAGSETPTTPTASSTPRKHEKAVPTRRRTAPVASTRSLGVLPAAGPSHSPLPPQREQPFDPFVDITRVRAGPQGAHCLYPGASFHGEQRSGSSQYDVSVRILEVDLASSFLGGYLCIRGLTEDWPEMTTYFDAEIIGTKYGFLTGKWGASEGDDLTHWGQFPAFRGVRHELTGPELHLPERERGGTVFMRWKERFLVPDHRVQDVNGASFAGFYYMCVDFDARPGSDGPRTPSKGQDNLLPPASPRMTREALPGGLHSRTPSLNGSRAPAATLSGFYYHANSEPYQHVSLIHVPQTLQSGWEVR